MNNNNLRLITYNKHPKLHHRRNSFFSNPLARPMRELKQPYVNINNLMLGNSISYRVPRGSLKVTLAARKCFPKDFFCSIDLQKTNKISMAPILNNPVVCIKINKSNKNPINSSLNRIEKYNKPFVLFDKLPRRILKHSKPSMVISRQASIANEKSNKLSYEANDILPSLSSRNSSLSRDIKNNHNKEYLWSRINKMMIQPQEAMSLKNSVRAMDVANITFGE